ncbi:MAG TPA: hypothetical protein VNQ73_00700 [Ilumatobacter sp.]|nr:hypothetical protein [Ilumatobacter sp.]
MPSGTPRPLSRPTAAGVAAPLASVVPAGATIGHGSVPHRQVAQAIDFAFEAYDVPSAPALPRRSPAEGAIAQALAGMPGVMLGQYGSVAIDLTKLDPEAPVDTDLASDGFAGIRAFLKRLAHRGHTGPVKWQFAGPLSVGLALRRAGADPELAFRVALGAVRAHVTALAAEFAAAAPGAHQIVVFDEPLAGQLTRHDFPLAPGEASDMLSAAMAAVEPVATVGVRARADADVAQLVDAGPQLLAIPVAADLSACAGYVERFLAGGGWVVWGVVATDGPVADAPSRAWNRLSARWCELVQCGCDPAALRSQALFAADGGLGLHSPAVAAQISATVADTARLARLDTGAARFVLGA